MAMTSTKKRTPFQQWLHEFYRDLSRSDANLPAKKFEAATLLEWETARRTILAGLEELVTETKDSGRYAHVEANGDGRTITFGIQLYDRASEVIFELSLAMRDAVPAVVMTEKNKPAWERSWPLRVVNENWIAERVKQILAFDLLERIKERRKKK